jgi:hypothetical protein
LTVAATEENGEFNDSLSQIEDKEDNLDNLEEM